MSLSSLLEKIASTREGSSCRANARLIKRPQAGLLKSRNKKESGSNQYSARGLRRWGRRRTALRRGGCGGGVKFSGGQVMLT